jgi:hypothetical protein
MSLSESPRRRAAQLFGSICILSAPIFLIAAFFYEPIRESLDRHVTLLGIILLSVGTMSHLLAGFGSRAADKQVQRTDERGIQ